MRRHSPLLPVSAAVLIVVLVLGAVACGSRPPVNVQDIFNPDGNSDSTGTDSSNGNGADDSNAVADGDDGNTSDNDATDGTDATNGANATGDGDTTTDDPPPLDSDNDGFPDDEEINGIPGTDPLDPNDTPLHPIDSDGDGCSDYDEINFANFCDNNPETIDPDTVEDQSTAFTFSLTVARHVDLAITDEQVDVKFAEATLVLQTVQTECPDVATNTTFLRDGSLTTFEVADAVVTSESQLDEIFGLPQDIKVVDAMIGVCGVPQTDDLAFILGCAFAGGTLVITADADSDVWAHEWGHVQGLDHRDGCPRNLMHSFEVNTNALDEIERLAFLTPTPTFGAPRLAMRAPVDREAGLLARFTGERLNDWLGRVAGRDYLAGVPSGVLVGLGPEAGDALVRMLGDPALEGRRRNIARMLGFTRDLRAVEPLVGRITDLDGELSFDEFATVAESFLALGRLADQEFGDDALNWLIAGTDPDTWPERGIGWGFRAHRGRALHRLLTRFSVMALGVSERHESPAHLRTLRDRGALGMAIDGTLLRQVNEALARKETTARSSRLAADAMRQP